jgi:hypothetical protein
MFSFYKATTGAHRIWGIQNHKSQLQPSLFFHAQPPNGKMGSFEKKSPVSVKVELSKFM